MELLSALGLRVTAESYDSEDLYDLVVAVLPIFISLAERRCRDLSSRPNADEFTDIFQFCVKFNTVTYNLNAFFAQWDPTESIHNFSENGDKIKKTLMRILDELENRFISQKMDRAGQAFRDLRFERRKGETYPKLCALVRIRPNDDAFDEVFLMKIDCIIRIDNRARQKRQELLQNLQQALHFFFDLLRDKTQSASPCPLRLSDYPLKHVRKLSVSLFDVLQTSWRCQCSGNSSHVSRQTRLNLTKHQRFETAARGKIPIYNETRFRLLFPTNSRDIEWQDTEIIINSWERNASEHMEAEDGVCGVIQGVKTGIRPRMKVFEKRLWQLPADVDINRLTPPQVRDGEFKSLKNLLQPNQSNRSSLVSRSEGKDLLKLSFVLATSFMHFFRGPWLQQSLSSENICFLVSNQRALPDITRPYLTTSCSFTRRAEAARKLNQPHRFPDILSLGILLLEIARGASIEVLESQDSCVVALECLDKWAGSCGSGRARTIHDCLYQSISACVDPGKFRNVLDKPSIADSEVREYIFERILYPLGNALSTVYEVPLDTLYKEPSPAEKTKDVGSGSFDHENENRPERQKAADEWFEYLDKVHDMYYECEGRCVERGIAPDRVKIAVLDTGFQLPEALGDNYKQERRINLEESESFVPAAEGEHTSGWEVDCDGHGSRVGQIILQVAPAADLHIAKVLRTRQDLADPSVATKAHARIAEAISRATNEWKVDMIVMCFGFDEPISLIRDAIDKAVKTEKSPLFLAATRNDGAHKAIAWPARDISVIGVSSTSGDGSASPFNPADRDAQPILHAFGEGVRIKAAHPGNPSQLLDQYVSGTSYAAPVAAALAANLLGCVRMTVNTSSQEDRSIYGHVVRDLEQMRGMLTVLRRHMQKEHACGVRSLLPWDFLHVDMLEDNRILRDIARALREG